MTIVAIKAPKFLKGILKPFAKGNKEQNVALGKEE